MSVITHRTPIHPRTSHVDRESPTLLQFVVLSMLLHVLIVVVFGNPIGTARRGDGWWGPLSVTLQRLLPDNGSGFTLAPGADASAPGRELLRPRDGGAFAPALPAPSMERQDRTAPPSEAAGSAPAESAPAPVPPIEAAPLPDVRPPAGAPTNEPFPRLDLRAPEIVDRPLAPPSAPGVEQSPPAAVELHPREITLPPLTPLPRIAPPKTERELAPPVTVPQREIPIAPVAPIERMAPPMIERELAPPVTVPQREIPIAPVAPIERLAPPMINRELAPPVTVPQREIPIAPLAPIERLAPPMIDRELAPPVTVPQREIPIAPVAPIERLAPPKIERELAPPVSVPQREIPIAPVAPIERLAPPKIERELAPAVSVPAREVPVAPVERVAPRQGGRESNAAPESRREPTEATPRATPAAPALVAPATAPTGEAPAAPPSRLRFGSPDVEDEIFKPRNDVVVPSAEPGGGSRIDLDAARRRAREITSESSHSRGIVSLVPPPPAERKSKLGEDIEKAAKPDCRTAYAGLGLLAIVPLVGSTIGNGGCNW